MRILPILFNTDMVQAILDNRKTCTRRIVKGYIPKDGEYGEKFFKLPYQKGDILYVRETWCKGSLDNGPEQYFYKADDHTFLCKWHPSSYMPKEAARIWLKVMDVRVERLQEITEEQARAEGAIDSRGFIFPPDNEYNDIHSAKEHFEKIWNYTIKKSDLDTYGWDANPYVWVIEFERCKKPRK